MGMRVVSSSEVSPRLDLVSSDCMLSSPVVFASSTQARDLSCVNMAKRGLIGEKIPLFFVESPDLCSVARGWQVC